MEVEADWLESELDFSECDTLAIRKLVSAVFTEALSEAALLGGWADTIIANHTPHNLPIYNTASHFLSNHESLSSFLRCRYGTELLDWLQYFSEKIDSEEYWGRLEKYLDGSRHAIGEARKVVNRGMPKE